MPIQHESKFAPLFYMLSTSQESYTADAGKGGGLAIGQLLANDSEIWLDPSPQSQPLPKKLIFTDFTKNNYEISKQDKVAEKLKELFNQGFSIYVEAQVQNQFELLTLEDIDEFIIKKIIRPRIKDEEELITLMSKEKLIPREQFFILDQYWIEELLHEQEALQREYRLKHTDICVLPRTESELLKKSIAKKRLGLSISINSESYRSKVKKDFPEASITQNYRTLSLDDKKLSRLRQEDHDWSTLTSLEIHQDFDQDSRDRLMLLMSEKSRIETLVIEDVKQETLQAIVEHQDFFVKKIHIKQKINSLTFDALLKKVPGLKKIQLEDHTVIDFRLLDQYKNLDLYNSKISIENFQGLLAAYPALEEISLRSYKLLGEESLILAPQSLPELKFLDLSGSEISIENLNILLAASPALVGFNCDHFLLKESHRLAHQSLPQLRSINLSSSHISLENLKVLLESCLRLEFLALNSCKSLATSKLEINPAIFKKLKILSLSYSSISLENLQFFLASSPVLEEVDLSGCKVLDVISLVHNSLPELKSLDLSGSTISIENINVLLRACPALEDLNLQSCQLLEGASLSLESHSLPELKKMTLSQSKISIEDLNVLLAACPALEELHLGSCQFLGDGSLRLESQSLPKLKILDLSKIEISIENLQTLVNAMPNIEDINLCSFDEDSAIILESASLQYLTKLNMLDSNIQKKTLIALLDHAPEFHDIEGFGKKWRSSKELSVFLKESTINDQEQDALLLKSRDHTAFSELGHSDPNHDRQKHTQEYQDKGFNDTMLSDPTHNPNDHRTPTQDPEFNFTGKNKALNQSMLVEKLSQYMTLKKKHLQSIPEIQKGICNALSHLFLNKGESHVTSLLEAARSWDGQDKSLTRVLMKDFDRLLNKYIPLYQGIGFPSRLYSLFHPLEINRVKMKNKEKFFIGDELPSLLNQQKTDSIFSNPWHAIGAHYESKSQSWSLYDPNYVDGIKRNLDNETASAEIYRALGRLVSVQTDHELALNSISKIVKNPITNPNKFIQEGGLLSLAQSENAEVLLKVLAEETEYNAASLEGLCLYGLDHQQAWRVGLNATNKEVSKFTAKLLQEYKRLDPQAESKLVEGVKSIHQQKKERSFDDHTLLENLTIAEQTLKKLDTSSEEHLPVLDGLKELLRTPRRNHSDAFKLWTQLIVQSPSVHEYMQECFASHKCLINCESSAQVEALRSQLCQYASSIQRPMFYVDKPSHLRCSAAFIEREQGEDGTIIGVMKEGPGGPLFNFLQKNKEKDCFILINYSNFKAEDIIRFNSMLDATASVDSVKLDATTHIIGLRNSHDPACYQGRDFTSRFDTRRECPFDADSLKSKQSPQEFEESQAAHVLNFFNAVDWEAKLFDSWILNGDVLTFKESEFIKAVREGQRAFELKNLPITQPMFDRLRDLIDQGQFYYAGERVEFPVELNIKLSARYEDRARFSERKQMRDDIHREAHPLNPTLLESFFGEYAHHEGKIFQQAGLLEQGIPGDILSVQLTRDLTALQWERLLTHCEQKEMTLEVHHQPDTQEKPRFTRTQLPQESRVVIVSTDPDTTVAQYMAQQDKDYHLIDLSECHATDLISKIEGKFHQETLTFTFEEKQGPLKTFLADGGHLLLKGTLTEELNDRLTAFLWNEQKYGGSCPGSLVLVTDDRTAIASVLAPYHHEVTAQEKKELIKENDQLKLDDLSFGTESLSKLQARARMGADDPWRGMRRLERSSQKEEPLNIVTAASQAGEFWRQRVESFERALHKLPFVFLAGHSGVGKSTFMEREVREKETLYLNEAGVKAWAQDCVDNGKKKVLFIDEANLTSKNWSQFEGLMHEPRRILIDGTLHELTSAHKVVFAGNPLNYGDERQAPSLFERHGCSVLFEELPRCFLYESILKPILLQDRQTLEAWQEACNHLLTLYEFIDRECRSSEEVLISARELQMMGLLLVQRVQFYPNTSLQELAKDVGYALTQGLIPRDKQREFERRFKPNQQHRLADTLNAQLSGHSSGYLFTPSRQDSITLLEDFLRLSQRRKEPTVASSPQLSGGLGGVILEGEPGIGKTELVIHVLRKHGYQQQQLQSESCEFPHPFYVIPVSMQAQEKEALLLKAFDEGAVVIIDEINSAPMMERLLNELLMGKYQGRDPLKPGFMIVGTQNPVSMGGRRAMSAALSRRTTTIKLEDYSPQEMRAILQHKGIQEEEARQIVDSYIEAQQHATRNKLSPVPCMRDLIKYVDLLLKAHVREKERPCLLGEVGVASTTQELLFSGRQGKAQQLKAEDEADIILTQRRITQRWIIRK